MLLLLPVTAVLKAAAAKATVAAACTSLPASASASHSIFNPIAKPIADVLAAFYTVVPNYGVAILAVAVVWMLIIAPLTLKSTRSMLAMQKLQPELKKLQAEHKNDRQAFAQAQMELFKERGVSPFGSCLPTLLPLPVFFALFRVIEDLSHTVKYNGVKCAAPEFLSSHAEMYRSIVAAGGKINAFGLNLADNALSSHSSLLTALPYFLLLLIMIGTQYLQTQQMMARNKAAQDNPQMKMMKYLPILFGVICIRFPAGVILYYAMSNVCRMAQQTAMYRWDPKVKSLVAEEVIEVESITRDIDRSSPSKSASKSAPQGSAQSKGRIRDLLERVTEQQQAQRGPAKPGSTPSKATGAAKGTAAKGANTKGTAAKGANTKGTPAKAPGANKAAGAAKGRPTSPAKAPAGSPGGSAGGSAGAKRKASTGPAQAASTGANQAVAKPAGDGKSAGDGKPAGAVRANTAPQPATNPSPNQGTSNGSSGKSPRTGAGSRTGAQPSNKKRRGR